MSHDNTLYKFTFNYHCQQRSDRSCQQLSQQWTVMATWVHVVLDGHLTMSAEVSSVCRSAFYQLNRIKIHH